MKRLLYIIYVLALALALAPTVEAQQPRLRNFSTINAGSGKQNWDIDQDEAGRMLFANNEGLLVFDGVHWETYHVSNHTIARSVKYDRARHVVFIGATNEFGYFQYSAAQHTLVYHSLSSLLPEKQRQTGEIWDIEFEGKNVVFKSISEAYVCDSRLKHVSRGGGLLAAEQAEGARRPGDRRPDFRRSLTLQAAGRTIVATARGELYERKGRELVPVQLDISPYLKQNEVFCATTNGVSIVFGTVRGGVVAKNLKTGRTTYLNTWSSLADNTVLALHYDNVGNLWMGLDNGVACASLDMPFTDLFASPYNSIGTGYASLQKDGRLYLGTNQGLFYTSFPLTSSPRPMAREAVGGITGQIWNLRNIDGVLLCAADKGTYVVSGSSATKVEGLSGTWNFVELKFHPGFVLVSDYTGLAVLHKTGASYVLHARLKGYNESSGNIVEDTDGTLWLSHWQKGIFHFRLSEDLRSATLIESFGLGRGLYVTEGNLVTVIGGEVFVSTVDGFYRYNRRTHKLERDVKMSTLFNTFDNSLQITETPDGHLWALKGHYLAIARRERNGKWAVDSTTYKSVARRLQVGLGSPGVITPDVTIFNANTGFVVVSNHQTGNRTTNPVIISRITSTSAGDSLLYSYAPGSGSSVPNGDVALSLRHREGGIRVEYVMPEYRDEGNVVYSTYMEHYDEAWSSYSQTTAKEYKLGRGTYVFHVRARNLITGEERETQITIDVAAAWYESWWAMTIYVVLLGLLVYYVARRMKRHADRELRRVKAEQEQERIRMKNDQLETELKHRSSELADSTMNLVRKNDMLQQIDTQMAELSESVRREDAKAKITKAISDIRHGIQASLGDDENWDKFEKNFDLVYDNFMQKIRQRVPNLNKTDLKLCAYLRMDLSSKEMASLLNISVRSIETARYRLRKKLGLEAGENLTGFIQKLEVNE